MKKKRNMIMYIVGVILLIALLLWIGKMNRETRANIELYGIETVGTVTRQLKGRGAGGGFIYGIRFEFEDSNGNRVAVSNHSKRDYDNAVIGMQYKVKFLPNSPKHAIIFIDQPIEPAGADVHVGAHKAK
jgi:long-subunit fatty acid transport protein